MNISRRWFLKSAVMAVVATQLPLLAEEGHRVLFIDEGPLLVTGFIQDQGIIRAKVVNGAWDLVLDTHKKMAYAYSNTSYAMDAISELKSSWSYQKLLEVSVSKSIGDVPEEKKPYTTMIPKFVEETRTQWVDGEQVAQTVMVPSLIKRTESWGEGMVDELGEPIGTMTMSWWEQETYPLVVDPLHGAGVDYDAVIMAAENKAGIVRPECLDDYEDIADDDEDIADDDEDIAG
jgi:hypothetical protein